MHTFSYFTVVVFHWEFTILMLEPLCVHLIWSSFLFLQAIVKSGAASPSRCLLVREIWSTWGPCFRALCLHSGFTAHLIVSGYMVFFLAGLWILQGQPQFSFSLNLCLPPSKHSFILGTKAMHDIMEENSALHMIRSGNFYFVFLLSSSPLEPLLEWVAEHRPITY